MSEMKNILDKIKGREDIARKRLNNLENIAIETIQDETQTKKDLKNKRSISELWTSFFKICFY